MKLCSVPGCGRKHNSHGLCTGHRYRVQQTGDAHDAVPLHGKALAAHYRLTASVEASALPPLEREEQKVVADLFKRAGFKVRSTSQKRAARVSPGIPDLMAHHRGRGLFLWFEVKAYRPQGYPHKQTPRSLEPDQVAFREDALACGQRHEWGGRNEARAYLESVGILKAAA